MTPNIIEYTRQSLRGNVIAPSIKYKRLKFDEGVGV